MNRSVATTVEFMKECLAKYPGRQLVALTGAGCSTASGIPDYRSPNGLYSRPNYKPLTWQNFMSGERERKRYWSRSLFGYSFLASRLSNACHDGLFVLQQQDVVKTIVTQNVDGLHHFAANHHSSSSLSFPEKVLESNASIIELHGNIHQVICVHCQHVMTRQSMQDMLVAMNEALLSEAGLMNIQQVRPDGDYEASLELIERIQIPKCEKCKDGILKPHVVLFGENVRKETVSAVQGEVTISAGLVCLGTSLKVYSAFRFVKAAIDQGIPVAVINNGVTRADGLPGVTKLDCENVVDVLPCVVEHFQSKF